MIEGIDTATRLDHVAATRLHAAGARFACRYIAPPGSSYDWKRLTRSEAAAIQAAGLAVVLVFESSAGRAAEGHAAGAADAAIAKSAAAELELAGAPVYFAVDFDATPAQLPSVVSYLKAAAGVLGHERTGVYGGLAACRAARHDDACAYYWQTYAWSGGVWMTGAQLQQYENGVTIGGVSVDRDRATVADYGQYHHPRELAGWTVHFTSRKGEPAEHRIGLRTRLRRRQPDSWVKHHHSAFTRGRVTFKRRLKG